ncbi:MAG: STAS domain-containing protein [Gammaproteobacteria bacterium]|nr:STAS domain-containing protein [Gammaproteobacteria bacterium]MBU1979327.1 STAS domain-containing protein [Gammaproteobacteria bacterium]
MQITVEKKGETARLVLNGRFDFSSHREFRNACDEALQTPEIKVIEADFSRVDYLDSSALGMLLLLREKAQNTNLKVSLTNCTGLVQQVLDVANFQRLFTIS